MNILNRRNAFLGWVAWQVGKRILKRKAKSVVAGRSGGSRWPKTGAMVASVLAALGGAFWFWRRQRDEDTD